MDGDGGLGFVVGHRAMTEAMRRAQEVGAGFVTVRNSSHLGAGAGYSMMALSRDMIGISLTTGGKLVAAPGASGRGSGVNVVSVAAPTKEEAPFVLDMATTAVAAGKIEIALRKGVPIPPGWGVDSAGEPILDPRSFFENKGALLFLGGTTEQGSYKGFGLSVMVDILCSILAGSASITQLITDSSKLVQATHFFGAIRIDGLMPVEDFKAAMDIMIRQYKSLPKATDQDEITLAGEPENNTRKERLRSGIPLHPDVVASLRSLAEELGMEYDL
jgi:LDH2 family malate/lactate/ureidoglycolate dehydrogenase